MRKIEKNRVIERKSDQSKVILKLYKIYIDIDQQVYYYGVALSSAKFEDINV